MPRRHVTTKQGAVAFADVGEGHPALFIHGVFFNADIWKHQLAALGDLRRCIAVDLLAHGESEPPTAPRLDIERQVAMLLELLDELGLEHIDLVGNDSGGAIAQLIVAAAPTRVSSLVLTNCDTHDNWPPKAFQPIVDLARSGLLSSVVSELDDATARASLESGFEDVEFLSDEEVDGFFAPFRSSPEKARALQDYVASMDSAVTVGIKAKLAAFDAPTLIVWGTGDVFFDVEWAHWLAKTIPGTRRVVELEGARLFFPMERATDLNDALRSFWADTVGR
jgi:pimeloyl-ACP methyl ester carboxylesterase